MALLAQNADTVHIDSTLSGALQVIAMRDAAITLQRWPPVHLRDSATE